MSADDRGPSPPPVQQAKAKALVKEPSQDEFRRNQIITFAEIVERNREQSQPQPKKAAAAKTKKRGNAV